VKAPEVLCETERLILRRFGPDDVDLLVELDGDPEVMRYITGGISTSSEEVENEVLPAFLAFYERHEGYGFWAAIEKDSGEFIGWFHLRPVPGGPTDEPELGYRLRRSAWGRGLATEGSRALIDVAFDRLGARRVFAHTMTVHVASRRVMERAGMTFVREFHEEWPYRIEGEELGDVEYEITRERSSDCPVRESG
jgi:RimJ/RimL family protein N-acetyltransferase